MEEKFFYIDNIPAVQYGDPSGKVYIFVHGKMGYKEEASDFAQIVCPKGWQVLSIDLPGHGERKREMASFVPWKTVPELQTVMKYAKFHWSTIALRANSIGAWFSMLAYGGEHLERSLFVSPVLDMVRLIENMMKWSSVTAEELEKRKIIPTDFGEILDWNYYQYAKANGISVWNFPTSILYADRDNLTERHTVDEFVKHFGCELTVMENGEHWFHTPGQLEFLNKWILENC